MGLIIIRKRVLAILIILTLVIIFFILSRSLFISNREIKEQEMKIKSLPYVDYSIAKEPEKNGTTVNHLNKTEYFIADIVLFDTNGESYKLYMPDLQYFLAVNNMSFIVATPCGAPAHKVAKFALGSRIWELNLTVHHDAAISQNKTYLLSKEIKMFKGKKVEFDTILVVSDEGKVIEKWSSFDNREKIDSLNKKFIPLGYNETCIGGEFDYYHINSIQVIPENDLEKKDKRFKKGNWLVSVSYANMVIILDNERKIVWSYGPETLDYIHGPRMLKNGNILVFDNGATRNYSRVIEINPPTKKIVWEYSPVGSDSFFTYFGGFAQPLDDGGFFITDTENGRVFEINRQKEILWEWYSPKWENNKRETIYRATKISIEETQNIIDSLKNERP